MFIVPRTWGSEIQVWCTEGMVQFGIKAEKALTWLAEKSTIAREDSKIMVARKLVYSWQQGIAM